MVKVMTMPTPHLCDCGCGRQTAVAVRSNTQRGYVRGLSFRFIGRHHAWKGDEAGYRVKHAALSRHFPKAGVCEECGKPAVTEYALIHGHAVSRDRADYRELCKSCHHLYDTGGERHYNARLTPEAVLDIRRRWAGGKGKGEKIAALAQEYGVSPAAVYCAATGRTWRHLPLCLQCSHPPAVAVWSARHPLKVETAGSNPARRTQ
jgi:hypothetical protein